MPVLRDRDGNWTSEPTCDHESGCQRPVYQDGLCADHWRLERLTGSQRCRGAGHEARQEAVRRRGEFAAKHMDVADLESLFGIEAPDDIPDH